ncbi:hypothetical protein M9458_050598 [Cirrhinus mrigala]|uniref:Uncharacterized protein n=1 Tax=Cirrhinus mrigala TaxID=683832 RepID=A0ABD0MVV9_CIRMR
MDLASINVVPRRGNTILECITIFIFQNGRDLEDYDGAVESTAAEGDRSLDLGHLDIELDLTDFTENIYVEQNLIEFYGNVFEDMRSLPPSYELSACLDFPPTLSPSVISSCWPCCLSPTTAAHPQPIICAVGSPRVCQSPSAPRLEDPSSPPPASESWTLPRPSDPAAPLRLSAPLSPPLPVGPSLPPGSLVPPAPSWSVVVPPSPQDSTPPAALVAPSHRLPPAPPQSSVAPTPLRTSGSPPPHPPRSPEPWAPPWPSGSSVSPRIFSSPSPPWAPPPLPPSVGPLESSVLPPPWLLPPSAPPWATIMAAAWASPGSSYSGSLLCPPWLLPPSDPPWTLLSPAWLLPPSSPPWTLLVVRPPPGPPSTLTFCSHSTSTNVTPLWTVYVGFSLLCPYIVFPVPVLVKSLLVKYPHLSLRH